MDFSKNLSITEKNNSNNVYIVGQEQAIQDVLLFDVATSGSNTTIVNFAAHYNVNEFSGMIVKVKSNATGEIYRSTVLSNTSSVIQINPLANSYAVQANDEFTIIIDNRDIGALNKASDSVANYPVASAEGNNLLSYSVLSAASNNAATIKSGPGALYGITLANNHTGVQYVRLYNKDTTPAPASDTPILRFILNAGASREIMFPYGLFFTLGLGIAITGVISDTDNTNAEASKVAANVFYV